MKPTIAIISEDPQFVGSIEPLLKSRHENVRVIVCQSYEEIEETISSFDCQLVLVDGAIEYMSCFEAIIYLSRKSLYNSRIWFFPEIMSKSCIYKSKAMGVNHVISRTFDRHKITNEIISVFTHLRQAI